MSAALRMKLHSNGKEEMSRGDYNSALETLRSTLNDHGSHVGLISDIITCHYLLGHHEESLHFTQLLQSELKKCFQLLTVTSLAKTLLFLGKILEEQAELSQALEYYKRAADLAKLDIDLRLRAQVQVLRLQSFLMQSEDLARLYQLILQATPSSPNLRRDIEHGLLLAELCLFGSATALVRLNILLSDSKLLSVDRRLFFIDTAEFLLSQGLESEALNEYFDVIPKNDFDEFESFVFSILQNGFCEKSIADLFSKANKMSTMCFLRVLALSIKYAERSQVKLDLRLRMNFILNMLTSKGKSLLIQKWKKELRSEKQVLFYSSSQLTLKSSQAEFSFKLQSFANRCLAVFVGNRSVSLEAFVTEVFETTFNDSYHDRIRIAINRLNRELLPITGEAKLLILRKEAIFLSEDFDILPQD